MSFSNKPKFEEEIEVRLVMRDSVPSQGLSDCPLLEVDKIAAHAPGDLLGLPASSPVSAALTPEELQKEPKQPKDESCRPLNLGFLRGYWIAVACGGFFAVGVLYLCISWPALVWYFSIFIFASLILLGWACEQILWSKRAAAAVSSGVYSWADVTILREPEAIDEELLLHVLINKTLLLPISNIDNGFDQHLLLEIIHRPAARRKVFYLAGSELPVAVATETAYLLLGRSGGPFWFRYAVPLTLIWLGVQCLLYFFWGDLLKFFLFP